MGLHGKWQPLLALKPDIAVISECANLDILRKKAPSFLATSNIWVGDNPNKGLGVFTFGACRATLNPIFNSEIPYFAPVQIEGSAHFNLLAVWACHAKRNSYVAKVGPLKRALVEYRKFIADGPTVVAGDFNDNVRWDGTSRVDNHSSNVSELEELGLNSAYHWVRGVPQGWEQEPTIYWRNRTSDGPRYHIDYCFVPNAWTQSKMSVGLGAFEDWVEKGLSDHVPMIVDIGEF
jgi:exodeoxyribonuclease-3